MMSPLDFSPGLDRPLPQAVEIVVIGGGVVGVIAALMLAEWGVPVLLCEKGRVAGEQSSRNWGWIRIQGRDLREIPLMLESEA
ncbi:MAG: FAD-dependent oxidoreductase, partial [Alphaproteobacteria bacterium]|nr:FAD-dependent oxidoreductase [Alphaproteobacteria bacterium]